MRYEIHTGLVRKPKERRPLERPRHMGEVNIEMDHKDMGWEGVVD